MGPPAGNTVIRDVGWKPSLVQGPGLPGLHLLDHLVGDPADGLLGYRGAVDLLEVRGDLPGGQALGIQRQDDLIDPGQPPLPLLDDLRLERPVPVPGHLHLDLAGALGQHRLGPGPVTDVPRVRVRTAVLLMPQVLGQLLVQRCFQHRLSQLLEQTVRPGQRQALLPGPPHHLLRRPLLSGRLPLGLLGHVL